MGKVSHNKKQHCAPPPASQSIILCNVFAFFNALVLCVSFILLVVLYALVPFSGKRITKLTNKVCFLSTNASYGMRIGSGTANKFPPERWSISKRSTVWENAKNPSPMALTMPYVYTCKWICIDTIISDLQKTWEKIKHPIPRLQHLERCNPQVGLSYEQTTVEIREIQPQVTSLLSPNETGKNPKRLQSYTKGMLRHHLESWGGPQETVARWDGLSAQRQFTKWWKKGASWLPLMAHFSGSYAWIIKIDS